MAFSLSEGLSDKQLSLRPFCTDCGWRKGGQDSWDGVHCKCGSSSPTFKHLFAAFDEQQAKKTEHP